MRLLIGGALLIGGSLAALLVAQAAGSRMTSECNAMGKYAGLLEGVLERGGVDLIRVLDQCGAGDLMASLVRGSERRVKYPEVADCLEEAEASIASKVSVAANALGIDNLDFYVIDGDWLLLKVRVRGGEVDFGSSDPGYGKSLEFASGACDSSAQLAMCSDFPGAVAKLYESSINVALPVTSGGRHLGEIQVSSP